MKPTMHEFKSGTLHSGSKAGPVVKNRKQAIAIGLSEAKAKMPKVPRSTNPTAAPTKPTKKTPGKLFTPKLKMPKPTGLY